MRTLYFPMLCLLFVACSCSGPAEDSPDAHAGPKQAADRVAAGASAEDGSGASSGHTSPGDRAGQEEGFRSRVTRVLHDTLEHVEGGTSEERQLIQETWEQNDEELAEILDTDLSQKIRDNNNPRP